MVLNGFRAEAVQNEHMFFGDVLLEIIEICETNLCKNLLSKIWKEMVH